MSSERFDLDERRFDEWVGEIVDGTGLAGFEEEIPLNLEIFVVAATDDPAHHSSSDPLLLAWFVYLFGTSGCWRGPEGFDTKAVLAHAVRAPIGEGEDLLLVVRHSDSPAVAVGPLSIASLVPGWQPSTIEQGRRWLQLVAKAVLVEASTAIPAARAASQGPGTIVLDQEQIDDLGIEPVLDGSEPEIGPADVASELKAQGVAIVNGKHSQWTIQAMVTTDDQLRIELLDPVYWENGPALSPKLVERAEELGFIKEAIAWVLEVPIGEDEEAALAKVTAAFSELATHADSAA